MNETQNYGFDDEDSEEGNDIKTSCWYSLSPWVIVVTCFHLISPPHFTFIWTEEEQWDRGPVVGTLTWRGEVFNIHSGVTLLGKIPHAGGGQYIKLDHKSISDKHATITYENGTDVMDRQPFLTSYILIFSFLDKTSGRLQCTNFSLSATLLYLLWSFSLGLQSMLIRSFLLTYSFSHF